MTGQRESSGRLPGPGNVSGRKGGEAGAEHGSEAKPESTRPAVAGDAKRKAIHGMVFKPPEMPLESDLARRS